MGWIGRIVAKWTPRRTPPAAESAPKGGAEAHPEAIAASAAERLESELPALEEAFRSAAEATGRPRGLRWTRVRLAEPALIARDSTGGLLGLVSAEIAFEAIPGGEMEEVEAVGNLRAATAVFHFRDARWTTEGRAVFNHTPEETLKVFGIAEAPLKR